MYHAFCIYLQHVTNKCTIYLIASKALLHVSMPQCITFRESLHACDFGVTDVYQINLSVKFLYFVDHAYQYKLIVFFYQLDAQILYFNTFIILLYMFRALLCPSSGGQLYQYSICYRHCLQVTVQTTGYESPLVNCGLNSHLKRLAIPGAVLIQLSS